MADAARPFDGPVGLHDCAGDWWLPRLLDQGWNVRPLGLPIDVDSMSTVAVLVDVTEQAWIQSCGGRSIPGPMLVWQGLPVIERPAIRDLIPAT
jgi:acyl-homoserine lactone synthase